MTPVFTLRQRPDGKFLLEFITNRGATPHGFYDSQVLGEDAIKRILNPEIHYYGEDGKEIKT